MTILKNKSKVSTVALVLMLAMAALLVALPTANAQATKNTFAIISALPNPVGVGQQTLITTGITHATQHPQEGWTGVTVTVEKPDGTTETLGPVMTDTTGMTGIVYVPAKVGTYYLQTHFPQQVCTVTSSGTPAGTVMLASTSDKLALIVTQEPRQYYPGVPLPSEYWIRPIDAEFREWTPIAGNWLGILAYDNRLPPDNDDAPESPHILWQKPLAEGGLVGGVDLNAVNIDAISYEHGDAYEGKWSTSIIMNGILFYNKHSAQSAMMYAGTSWNYTGFEEEQQVVAVDLHTGEELWTRTLGNNERLAFGQIFYWKTMNMYGAFSYLWTVNSVYNMTAQATGVYTNTSLAMSAMRTDWKAYDPSTGRWEYTIQGVPSGYRTCGPNGEVLIYTMQNKAGWMTKWNSTSVVFKTYYDFYMSRPADWPMADYWAGRWRPHGLVLNATKGYDWNVTIPLGLPVDTPGTTPLTSNIQTVVGNDRILGSNTNWAGGAAQPNPVFWAVSIKPGQEGRLLFNASWTLPQADVHVDVPGSEPASLEDGVFVVTVKELRTHYGFSLDTGEKIWGPTSPPEPYMSVWTNLYMMPWGAAVIKYGKLFTAGMGGVVNAYDVKTGKHLWRYNITDPYTEQLFSENWPAPICFIVDGKIYLSQQEHSANTPMPRGAPTVCLNATTGEEIWRINGLRLGTRWGGQPIIGDSIIAGFSSYDNTIVALGRGPSATTVTASPKVSVHGSSVLIEGTVTDVSPGVEDYALTARFPNGVPAVSDESMSAWMLYVYKQFPRPANATGVEVTLDTIDPNGNWIHIGTVTSDSSGMFKKMWTPEVPGEYTVIATFPGSKSYWASYAQTAIGVGEAPPPPAEAPAYTGIDLAIIAAVAVVAILVLYTLFTVRKQRK